MYLQASFSSVSSFDYLLSQQPHHYQHHHSVHQQQTQQPQQINIIPIHPNLDSYTEQSLFSPSDLPSVSSSSAPIATGISEVSADLEGSSYLEQTAQHSNSSSDTLVELSEHSSGNFQGSTGSLNTFKEEAISIADQDQDLLFETSSTEELGLLSLRSNSDPTLAANTRLQQPQLLTAPRPSTSVDVAGTSTLPSFQETYPVKFNQLATFGLKMDEDCYNIASPHQHQSVTVYHHGHHQNLHHSHYEFPQHAASSQYMTPGVGFYANPPNYEHNQPVSF